MANDRNRVQSVFQAVAGVAPAERAAALARACGGDVELRRCVEALLEAAGASGEVTATEQEPTGAYVPTVEPGQVFAGRYKLREKVGQGGMGVVFIADQTEPVQRRVALKIIRAGLDTHRLLARFEQERQALALMDHPNIAKVFDAGVAGGAREQERGTSDDSSSPLVPRPSPLPGPSPLASHPFFAMELVKGLPLTRYCDDAKLAPRERLELFIPVCQAVQHAHQKGIIHRDLKPSNILVGLYDGRPVPKVIDFGVAKATGPRLTEQTIYTELGSIIGTLEYMSPEQAELNNLDIDTRSDIYALGVILYELLTGAVPFCRKDLEKAGLAEMLRVIKEAEPPKPSTKLSHSGTLPSIAAQRQMEPKKLTALVRGELDWIVMKALEKDRGRRYETANGFAMDVQRYLAGEPVLAAPASAMYRLRKFVRRHRGPVVAAAVVTAALLGGGAVATWQAVRAHQAEVNAREAAHQAQAQREQARQWLQEARAVVDAYLGVVRDSKELQARGREQLLEQLLEPARASYERFVRREESDEPDVRAERARIYGQLGLVYSALKRYPQAETAYREAAALSAELVAGYPEVVQYQNDLAVTWHNLGNLFKEANAVEKAKEAYAQAAGRYQKLMAADGQHESIYRRELANCLFNLADLHARGPDLAAAEKTYGQALELEKDHEADATAESLNVQGWCHTGLGGVYERSGRIEEAGRAWQKAVAIRGELARQCPKVAEYQWNLAVSFYNWGNWLMAGKRWEEAGAAYRSGLAPLRLLSNEFPSVAEYKADLARIHNNLANARQSAIPQTSRAAGLAAAEEIRHEAEQSYLEAIRLRHELCRDYPEEPLYQQNLADSLRNLGVLSFSRTRSLVQLGRPQDALPGWERFLAEVKNIPNYKHVRGETCFVLACHVARVLTLLGADDPRRQELALLALALLKQARAGKYFDHPAGRSALNSDASLDALRQRADFRAFQTDVTGSKK